MLRLRVHGPDDLRLEERDDPVPQSNDVVVRVKACGICGTDLLYGKAGASMRSGAPLPLGHEASGIVASVGRNVKGLVPGMRVVLNPMARAARFGGSPDHIIGNGSPEGAFGEALLVIDAVLGEDLMVLPEGITFEQAALVDPLAVALHAIRRGGAIPGEKVVIYGAGPIGLAAILWLRDIGITDIVSIDLSPERLARAREMGARATIDAALEDVSARLAELHGHLEQIDQPVTGTDLFIDLAGGSGVVETIIRMAKARARVVIVAVHHQPAAIPLDTVLMKELLILGAAGYPTEFREVVDKLPALTAELDMLISDRFPFRQVHDAFEMARHRESAKVMVTFDEC